MPYNPDEPRDHYGRWIGGGASGAVKVAAGTTLLTEVPPEGAQRNPPFAYRAAPPPPPQRSYGETFYPTMRQSPYLTEVADRRQQVDPITAKKQAWVDAHYAEAKELAEKYGVTPEEILGIAALESGWGKGRFAAGGNNFFGQHAPAPGQSGTMKIEQAPGHMATFSGFKESVESFMAQNGSLIAGVKDPDEFARRLQNSGRFGVYRDGRKVPTYVGNVAGTIKSLGKFKPRR